MPVPASPRRIWRRSTLRGLGFTAYYARTSARVHPRARIDGRAAAIRLGHGVKVSEQCVLTATDSGTITLGERVWLGYDTELDTATHITIGSGTTVQRRSIINGTVDIGRGCLLAPNVMVSSGGHTFDRWPALPIAEQDRRTAPDERPVRIGDDCWIGINAVIAPGCTIGRGAVVGANSVVTGDVAPYAVVAGSPASEIRKRLTWEPPSVLDARSEEHIPYLLSGFDHEYGEELVATFSGTAQIALAPSTDVTVATEPEHPVLSSVEQESGWTRVTLTSSVRTRLIAATGR